MPAFALKFCKRGFSFFSSINMMDIIMINIRYSRTDGKFFCSFFLRHLIMTELGCCKSNILIIRLFVALRQQTTIMFAKRPRVRCVERGAIAAGAPAAVRNVHENTAAQYSKRRTLGTWRPIVRSSDNRDGMQERAGQQILSR